MDNVISATTAEGQTMHMKYDSRNRLTQVMYPLGESVEASYDYMNNITSLKIPNGQQFFYHYDQLNRLIKTSDAMVYSQNLLTIKTVISP